MDDLHLPIISEIAKLLLLCAPKDILTELELSEDSFDEFCRDYDFTTGRNYDFTTEYGAYLFYEIRRDLIVFALYYANFGLGKFLKSTHITKYLYIEPFIMKELVEFVFYEGFNDNKDLTIQLNNDDIASRKRKISKKRAEISEVNKHEKYYGRQEKFIADCLKLKEYKGYGKYTKAANEIAPKLINYIREHNLPVECHNGKPKEDWHKWVYNKIRKWKVL